MARVGWVFCAAQRSGIFAALILSAAVATAKPGADGVLAELPFLDPEAGLSASASHIAVDLAPEGSRAMPLLLDTGASYSVMTPRFAKNLGISVRRTKETPYRRDTVLGRDLQFAIDTSSSETASRGGWEVGLLGGNFIEAYTVEIDYVARKVRFLDRRKHPVSKRPTRPTEIIAPLQVVGRRPYVELALGGGKARFLVDTGAYFDLEISERLASRLGIEEEEGEIVHGRNWIGSDRSRKTWIESVRIGKVEVGPSELLTTLAEGSDWRHTNQAGSDEAVLGSEFLSRFHVTLDYKHGRMSLVPLSPEDREVVLASRGQPASPGRGPGDGLAEAEREELREEAARSDREAAERFEREKASRLFSQTPGGGWMRVEDQRLEAGPKDGETWYGFEDMQRIKAERKAAQQGP